MPTLERAIGIAAEAHAGQKDKAGVPYILHPLRIMMSVTGEEERIVAVLHDLIEDTAWTPERLRAEGFSETVVEALDSVTHRTGELYDAFVQRAAANPLGRVVKRADLLDNLDLSRIPNPTERDQQRMAKYRSALVTLASSVKDAGGK